MREHLEWTYHLNINLQIQKITLKSEKDSTPLGQILPLRTHL